MGVHASRLRAFVENVGRAEAQKRLRIKSSTLSDWLKRGAPSKKDVHVGKILLAHERTRKSHETKRKKKDWLARELAHLPPTSLGAHQRRHGIRPEALLPGAPPETLRRVKYRQKSREGRDQWVEQVTYQLIDGPGRSREVGDPVHIGEVIYLDGEMKRYDPSGQHPDRFDWEGFKQVAARLAERKQRERPDLGSIQVVIFAWWQVPFNPAYEKVGSLVEKWAGLQGKLMPRKNLATRLVSTPDQLDAAIEGALAAIGDRWSLTDWAMRRAVYIEGAHLRVFRRGADETLKEHDAELVVKRPKQRGRRR